VVVSVPESVLIDQRHHSGVPTLSSFPARRPRKPGTPFLDGASVVCSHQLAVPTRSGQTLRPLFVTSGAAGRGNPSVANQPSVIAALSPPSRPSHKHHRLFYIFVPTTKPHSSYSSPAHGSTHCPHPPIACAASPVLLLRSLAHFKLSLLGLRTFLFSQLSPHPPSRSALSSPSRDHARSSLLCFPFICIASHPSPNRLTRPRTWPTSCSILRTSHDTHRHKKRPKRRSYHQLTGPQGLNIPLAFSGEQTSYRALPFDGSCLSLNSACAKHSC